VEKGLGDEDNMKKAIKIILIILLVIVLAIVVFISIALYNFHKEEAKGVNCAYSDAINILLPAKRVKLNEEFTLTSGREAKLKGTDFGFKYKYCKATCNSSNGGVCPAVVSDPCSSIDYTMSDDDSIFEQNNSSYEVRQWDIKDTNDKCDAKFMIVEKQ
jgi:uncharacterized membrane protein